MPVIASFLTFGKRALAVKEDRSAPTGAGGYFKTRLPVRSGAEGKMKELFL